MKCPECVKQDLKSKVNVPSYCIRTAMCVDQYYDEDGKYHSHDMNTTSSQYTCSNGHAWTKISKGSCWCGWGKNEN